MFNGDNIWVKRPGTGEIKAIDYKSIIGKIAKNDLEVNTQIRWNDIEI
jgi:sialic acid synthase SpsE